MKQQEERAKLRVEHENGVRKEKARDALRTRHTVRTAARAARSTVRRRAPRTRRRSRGLGRHCTASRRTPPVEVGWKWVEWMCNLRLGDSIWSGLVIHGGGHIHSKKIVKT